MLGLARRRMVARSVAVIGRAKAAGAAAKASSARPASMSFFMDVRPSTAKAPKLEVAAGDPGDLAGDEILDDLGQMLVEPLLQDRPKHLANDRFQSAIVGGRLAALAQRREAGKALAAGGRGILR